MKYIYSFIASVVLFFSACSPDDFGLGAKDVSADELVEGIAFTVTHDSENPNIVYLESKLGSKYTPLWEHPQGRSQESKVTLKIPFAGTYKVKFGVETRGGVVYGEPTEFAIDNFYAGFVENELWTFLTGGVGKAKTWIHDNGEYGFASGEVDYSDPASPLGWGIPASGWLPGKGHTGDNNIWASTMTFNLIDGANVSIHNTYTLNDAIAVKDEVGTFMLNTDNYTLTFTDCNIMHTQGWDSKTLNWAKGLTLVALDENHLQVGVMRGGKDVSGEDPWWLVWNFVSKEYADSYVPADKPDPIPDIDGDPNDIITTSKSKSWALSLQSPYDWAKLAGDMMNGFSKPEDYNNGWSAYNAEMIGATKFVFTASDSKGGTYVFSSYENEDLEGSYTIDANNDITFDNPINVLISHTNWGWDSNTYLTTTAENKLRIIKTKTDVLGNVTDMWLGCRDTEKEQYTAYHFEVGAGGAPQVNPVKELKKRLCGGSQLTYKVDLAYPFCWAFKPGDASSHSIKSTEVFPGWTGWTDASHQTVNKMRFTFDMNGDLTYVSPDGTQTAATYVVSNADATYGIDIVKFVGFDIAEITYGGWVKFNFNKNPDGLLAKAPTDAGWLELYEWEYAADGSVSGLWFGIVQGDKGTIDEGATLTNQRRIFHFVVDAK